MHTQLHMMVLWHDNCEVYMAVFTHWKNAQILSAKCYIIAQLVTKKFKKMYFKKTLYNFHKEYTVNKKKNN